MILGLSISNFTTFHVVLSLAGILAGLVWLTGLLQRRWSPTWNAAFLALTFAATFTGFLFPIVSLTPALIFGALSLTALILAGAALLLFGRQGIWHNVYAASAVFALYLNAFVALVQAFQKIPLLHAIAPIGTEPAFIASQAALLAGFAATGFVVTRLGNRAMAPS